jgi:putative hydrolase of the HAD superfamily
MGDFFLVYWDPDMKNITTIFFDIDNTLINHSDAQLKAIEIVRNKYFPEIPKQKFEKEWLEIQQQMWERYARGELAFPQQRTQRIIAVWSFFAKTITEAEITEVLDIYLGTYEKSWEIFPQAVELLQLLSSKGYNLGVLTNAHRSHQSKKLQQFDILKYINQDLFFVPEEVGFAKPNSEFFLFAQNKAKVLSDQILFIGDDMELDIIPAKKLGWKTILIDHFNQYPDEKSVKNLKEVVEIFT